jgi:ABC-2 type transport system permease protein
VTQSPTITAPTLPAPAAPAFPLAGLRLPTLTLWRREMVRFFRQRNRVMSALVTPILIWLMLGLGLNRSFIAPAAVPGADANPAAGVGYLVYFFPGTITMILLFTAIFSTITVIEDRREGFLQGVLVSPAPRLAIVLGKVLGGASIAFIHALVFLIIWPFVAPSVNILLILAAVPLMLILAVAMTSLGVCIAWPMDSTAAFHAIMMVFLMPMWFLSGAVFPVSTAPLGLKIAMLANPLTYGHEAFAYVLTGGRASTGVPLHLSLCILITLAFAAGITWLAVRLVARARRDGT